MLAERRVWGLLLAITMSRASASVAMMARFAQSPTGFAARATAPPVVVKRNASVSPVVSTTPSADAAKLE